MPFSLQGRCCGRYRDRSESSSVPSWRRIKRLLSLSASDICGQTLRYRLKDQCLPILFPAGQFSGRSLSLWHGDLEELGWVKIAALPANSKVEVRAGRAAGGAAQRNDLTSANFSADGDLNL